MPCWCLWQIVSARTDKALAGAACLSAAQVDVCKLRDDKQQLQLAMEQNDKAQVGAWPVLLTCCAAIAAA